MLLAACTLVFNLIMNEKKLNVCLTESTHKYRVGFIVFQ